MKNSIIFGIQICIYKKMLLKENEKIWKKLISLSSKLICKDMFKERVQIIDLSMIIIFRSIILNNYMILDRLIRIKIILIKNIHQIKMTF